MKDRWILMGMEFILSCSVLAVDTSPLAKQRDTSANVLYPIFGRESIASSSDKR